MMSRTAAWAAFALACVCLTACEPSVRSEPAEPAAPPVPASPAAAPDAPTPAPVTPATEPRPAAPGAPAYAAIYPGGSLDGAPTIPAGSGGEAGAVTFSTAASPDAVVEFYKERAEDSGLASVMGMNQGDARAYGAAAPDGDSLQVVAAPGEDGETSVQLTWSEGQ